MRTSGGVGRRTVVVAGFSGMVSVAGCLDNPFGSSGPQDRTYEFTVTRSDGTLETSIEPAGDVEDVIQVNVGDTVTFEVVNDAGVAVGIHNHATGEEVVVAAGEDHTTEFEATESMAGRHEIEGWIAEDGHDEEGGHDEGGDGGGHGEDTTVLAVVEVRPGGS